MALVRRLACGATLALLALPLALVLLFDMPTLLGLTRGKPARTPGPQGNVGRQDLLHQQVKALQEQLAGLKMLRPAADAPLAEVQRWQEMRELLKRQVRLVMEDISGSADMPLAPQAGVPSLQAEPLAAPSLPAPVVEAASGLQKDSQAQVPLASSLGSDGPKVGTKRREGRRRHKEIRLKAAEAAGDGQPSSQASEEVAGAQPNPAVAPVTAPVAAPVAAPVTGAVAAPVAAAVAAASAPAKPSSPQPFSLRAKDPRYIVAPKALRLASLPDAEGSWRYCHDRRQQCKRCTLEASAPGPPCETCTSCPMTLAWPDQHPRTNPTMAAEMKLPSGGGADVFVKFACIPVADRTLPAAARVDPHNRCSKGINMEDSVGPMQHVMSIQRITDDCGLDGIAARYWVDQAVSVVEDGPFVNQEGIFAQTAPGKPLEKIGGERRERARAIPRDQILE
eukprot:jgi/Tetstr1/462681/TSEL_007647.t1